MEQIVKVDFHAHSVHGSNDAKRTFDQIAEESKEKGINVVVIAEHDNITEEDLLLEISEKHGILFIPGIELSFGEWGHFVAIGVNSFVKKLKQMLVRKTDILKALNNLREGLSANSSDFYTHKEFRDMMTSNLAFLIYESEFKDDPVRYCQKVHDEGGYITWAHPFVGTKLRKHLDIFLMQGSLLQMTGFLDYLREQDLEVIKLLQNLDAIEGHNGLDFGLTSYLAADLGRTFGKSLTAGSDGHDQGQYGKVYMKINCGINDIQDTAQLITAIKNCEISFGNENNI